jgi:hypothetical protein
LSSSSRSAQSAAAPTRIAIAINIESEKEGIDIVAVKQILSPRSDEPNRRQS